MCTSKQLTPEFTMWCHKTFSKLYLILPVTPMKWLYVYTVLLVCWNKRIVQEDNIIIQKLRLVLFWSRGHCCLNIKSPSPPHSSQHVRVHTVNALWVYLIGGKPCAFNVLVECLSALSVLKLTLKAMQLLNTEKLNCLLVFFSKIIVWC